MTPQDLLERRAERGRVRGAANVWADGQLHADSRAQLDGPRWAFRLALVAWAATMCIAALFGAGRSGEVDTASNTSDGQPVELAEPLPDPILADGMNLQRVGRPWDPDFDASDIFGSSNPPDEGSINSFGTNTVGTGHIVFASEDDAFSNVIFGLELFEDGGFQPWGVNLGDRTLREFTDQLVLAEGEWRIAESTGLVAVARFESGEWDLSDYGWQFDFVDGAREITLQAETRPEGSQIDEWVWISRIANSRSGVEITITEIDVLGRSALRVATEGRDSDQIVWVHNEFAYRLTASTLESDTYTSTRASGELDRLRVVETDVWVNAVEEAGRLRVSQGIALTIGLVLVAAVFVSIIFFALRQHWRGAAISCITLALLFFLIGFSPAGGPAGSSLLLVLVGLVLAWMSYRLENGDVTEP